MNLNHRRYSDRFRTWIWTSTSSHSRKKISWNGGDLPYVCSSMKSSSVSIIDIKIISQIKDIGSDPDGLKKS